MMNQTCLIGGSSDFVAAAAGLAFAVEAVATGVTVETPIMSEAATAIVTARRLPPLREVNFESVERRCEVMGGSEPSGGGI